MLQQLHTLLQDVADSSVQVLAWVKYAAIYCAAFAASRGAPANAKHTAEQYTLLAIIGLLDVFAFAANCTGIAFCGATVAALVLAAAQQLFTAAMSYFLLGRKLNLQQLTGVRFGKLRYPDDCTCYYAQHSLLFAPCVCTCSL